MEKEKWVWMPHAGHFILGHKCRFKLNTYVGKYIVSTIGEYVLDNELIDILKPEFKHLRGDEREYAYIKKYKCEDIGVNRKYETMVFEANKGKHKCCPYEIDVTREVDMRGYKTAEEAYKGHLDLCKKWSK
jgi:hypothetical protein